MSEGGMTEPLRAYLDALTARAEAATPGPWLAHARTDLPRLVQMLRLAVKELKSIADDARVPYQRADRAKKALAALDALAKEGQPLDEPAGRETIGRLRALSLRLATRRAEIIAQILRRQRKKGRTPR